RLRRKTCFLSVRRRRRIPEEHLNRGGSLAAQNNAGVDDLFRQKQRAKGSRLLRLCDLRSWKGSPNAVLGIFGSCDRKSFRVLSGKNCPKQNGPCHQITIIFDDRPALGAPWPPQLFNCLLLVEASVSQQGRDR